VAAHFGASGRGRFRLQVTRTIALCTLAVGARIYAAATNYYSQEVWTFNDNIRSLATAAFVAASSGSIAAVLIGSKSGRSG
jgi:hypothetical protein